MIWFRALFFVLVVQATVVGLVPYLLARREFGLRMSLGSASLAGAIPLAIGAVILLWCNYLFVVHGRGTAAPYEPPRALVKRGAYRYTRNPMYLSAILMVCGIAVLSQAAVLLAYALVLAVAYHVFIRSHEEPRLRRSFGADYEQYCARVPRWLPRRLSVKPRTI
jgi:protein-S-isoprenylcysteine O-methyltransferase Ste14